MLITTLLTMQAVLSTTSMDTSHCTLSTPPESAGETQAHGVILYIYPRSHTINDRYNGCQNQWFYDEDHYRKLSVIHYRNGVAVTYDNINLNGEIGYQCKFENQSLTKDSDKRCPQYEQLSKKTYRAGCHSKSKLNSSDSYDLAFSDCIFR